jgi:hypothetical protein
MTKIMTTKFKTHKDIIMNLDKMVTLAYSTNWTKINSYTIQMIGSPRLDAVGPDKINLALKSVTLPALTASPIETYVGGKWFVANGRADMARVEFTFRDFDNFTLYKIFSNLFELAQGAYPRDTANITTILINLDDPEGADKQIPFAKFSDMLIENVSQISFSNETENQVAEFSVTLRGTRQQISGTNFYENWKATPKAIK